MRTVLSARSLRITAAALAVLAACVLAGSLFSSQPGEPSPAAVASPALGLPFLHPQQEQKTAITPGEQRARMIKALESIDKRLASIETLLKEAQPKEGSDT